MTVKGAPLELHLRLCSAEGPLLGPGKRQLLGHILESKSLAVAARAMGMSYMRAWTLVQRMNREWRQPLVELRRGGNSRGGATVTATGEEILRLYDEIARASRQAARRPLARLAKFR